jgi:asparagine N-glycosylation enzyme membrane subunit Stt3
MSQKVVKYVQNWAVALILIFCIILPGVVVYPIANSHSDITQDNYEASVWLKNNTPEPFPSYDYYSRDIPIKPDYTVLCWWDYGNLIMRVGQRVPEASSVSQFHDITDFFGAQSQQEVDKLLEGSKVRYVYITKDMVGGIFMTVYKGFTDVRKYDRDMNNIHEKLANSMVYKLWNYPVEGYKLVYFNETVKIFTID